MKTDYSIDDLAISKSRNICIAASTEKYLTIINLANLQCKNIRFDCSLDKIVINQEETLLFIYSTDDFMLVLELPEMKQVCKVKVKETVDKLIFRPPNQLVAADDEGKFHIFEWDGLTITKINSAKCAIKEAYYSSISSDGHLALFANDEVLCLFDEHGTKKH